MSRILPLGLLLRPKQNDPQPLIIYHGRSCPDGFAAALAAWRFYQGRADFLALEHGQITALHELPELLGRTVYILDFSFRRDLLRAIEERAAQLVLLDHHKSAADGLQGFDCRCGLVYFDLKNLVPGWPGSFFYQTPRYLIWCAMLKTATSGPGSTRRAPLFWRRWTWKLSILAAGMRSQILLRPSWLFMSRAGRRWPTISTNLPLI